MGFLERRFLGRRESELEAIVLNLRRILDGKRGVSSFFPDFGLGEPLHRSTEESILRFSEEIRSTIARYEPRVRVIEIEEFWGDNDHPRLQVQLALQADGTPLTFSLDPLARQAQLERGPKDELEP